MSLKFNDALEIVAEKLLQAPTPEYQTYSQDAAEISEKMDQELFKINSIFKGIVSNWDQTTEFFKIEHPFKNVHLLLIKMPFTVEPQRVLVFGSNDVQAVNLKTSVNHPAVENGYLNGEKLTKLFFWDLNRVIDRISKVTCTSGKIYKLCIEFQEHSIHGLLVKITAKENDQDFQSISYEFVPYFVFTNKLFGYTYASNFFHQSDPSELESKIKNIVKMLENAKVLLQNLVNLPSRLLVCQIINSIHVESLDIGLLLLETIPRCFPHLQNPGPLIIAYGQLLQFKQSDSVKLSEIEEVFGLK